MNTPDYRYNAALLLLVFSPQSVSDSFNVSYGQLEQEVVFQDDIVSLNPTGAAVALSLDFADNWQVSVNYQQWDDDKNHLVQNNNQNQNLVNVDVDLTTWGGSLAYYLDNWSFSTSYSVSEDDTFISNQLRPSNFRAEDTRSKSWGGNAAYGWASGNWFYNVSGGVQYSDWDLNTRTVNNQPSGPPGQGQPSPPQSNNVQIERNSGDSTSLSTSLSAAHFWPITEATGVLLGALLSWNYVVDGESVLVSRNGQNTGSFPGRFPGNSAGGNNNQGGNSGALRSLSGDDSYGQLAIYVSYDLTSAWSLDLDTSVDIGSEYSATTWSLSLGYYF